MLCSRGHHVGVMSPGFAGPQLANGREGAVAGYSHPCLSGPCSSFPICLVPVTAARSPCADGSEQAGAAVVPETGTIRGGSESARDAYRSQDRWSKGILGCKPAKSLLGLSFTQALTSPSNGSFHLPFQLRSAYSLSGHRCMPCDMWCIIY